MFKIYFRQAWNLVKQHRLFTSIYVLGTGLSVALTMILFIVHYIKFAPIYPEENRGRTMVIKRLTKEWDGGKTQQTCCSAYLLKRLEGLPHAEAVGITYNTFALAPIEISKPGETNSIKTVTQQVNDGFWKVFTFRFLDGQPFNKADIESKQNIAVIQEEIALQLFGRTDVVGERIIWQDRELKITGVVENSSLATPNTYAGVWVPVSLNGEYGNAMKKMNDLIGNYFIYLLAPSKADKEALKEEVIDAFRQFESEQNNGTVYHLYGQPVDYWLNDYQANATTDVKGLVLRLLYLVMAMLFIPALNLSGMISSRMDHRLVEIGVRKAYGASNLSILRQVLGENLLLTFVGSMIGLLIAYLLICTCSQWILPLFDDTNLYTFAESSPRIMLEMIFNFWIIAIAFGCSLTLNLISAFIPTAWALRHSIIEDLHSKL